MSPRLLYAEVPGFYAEVERASDPSLAARPVIVGGDPRKRGLVQAATPDARTAGVEEGMPMLEALERCPRARARTTDMRRYREAAARLRACLRRGVERLETAGLAAAWLDASETSEPVLALAEKLQGLVRDELGLPLRVGAAPNKFLAKLAAEEAGPAGVRIIAAGEVAAFLRPLPAHRLPGVGPNTAARLEELGARTVSDVIALGRGVMEEAFGNHGLAIVQAALGQGDARVRATRHAQSLSQETTLDADERDRAELSARLHDLAERLARALALEGVAARRVTLRVRYADQEGASRTRTLARPVSTAAELEALSLELLGRTQAGTRPVRGLGLAASALTRRARDERQLDLFGSGS